MPAKEWDSDLITPLLRRMSSSVIYHRQSSFDRLTKILSQLARLHHPGGSYMKSC